MSYKVENIHFNDTLNVGINTETQITGTPGKIITIVDEDGGGIILPNGNVDQKTPNYYLTFQNTYLGSFSYNTNDDVFDIYSKHGWCPFDVNYLDNTSKADNNSISIIQNVTRIDFNNNKMSFRTDPSGITPVERLVINSSGNVGIGKSDIISNYDPSVKLDVNGSIHCLELYLNGTLLNPAPIYNLSGTITITNTGNRNINVSKIETNNLTINNCLTIKQTLDIYNNVNVNGTLIGNAMYKSTVSPNETSKLSSDKMYIHDVDINSVGLPKRTGNLNTNDRIYYRTDNNRIKTYHNILVAQDSNVINPPTLFNGTNPSGFNEVKSITYDSNWWGFELGKTSNNIICLGHIQDSIDETGVNTGGTVSVTVSENGSDTFDYYSEQSVRTGFTIKKSGYYYATVVFPLNGSTNSTKNFTFGFLKNTYSGTPIQNYLKTYSEFYKIANVSPLDDNDILFRIGSSKDTNYQIEGFSSDSPSVTPLPDPETGRIVTQANSNSSMNYSYEYSFPFVIATDGPHFVSFFATADGTNYAVHNGLRIRFIKYADFDETDFITSTYGSNSVDNPVSTNQAGVVLPASTTVTWLSDYATNGIPNGIAAATQVATLSANSGDAIFFSINSYNGFNTSGTSTLSDSPFYTDGNQLKINTFIFSRYILNGISFQITAYNTNGPQPSPTSIDIDVFFPVPSSTIVTWDDVSFNDGNVLTQTESGVTLATLSADTGDATSFSLITGSSLLTIVDSSLNTNRAVTSDDVGDFSFSIKAVNDTGTQVTATDFTLTVVQDGVDNTATVSIFGTDSQTNTLVSYTPSSTTGSYEENEYTDSDGNTYIAVRFTDDGSITFDQDTIVDVLLVAGGGGSGTGGYNYGVDGRGHAGGGGGGGGGGVLVAEAVEFTDSVSNNITVGDGGDAVNIYWTNSNRLTNSTGGDTRIEEYGGNGYYMDVKGGGAGASVSSSSDLAMRIGGPGGSGGGGGWWNSGNVNYSGGSAVDGTITYSYTNGSATFYGNSGGNGRERSDDDVGGGGGAGARPTIWCHGGGTCGSFWRDAQIGGVGIANNFWDGVTDITYGGGGGGSGGKSAGSGGDGGGGGGGTGTDGRGGGGGGVAGTADAGNSTNGNGWAGGSGVVILRFLKYQSYEETTSTDIISSYSHTTENVNYNSVKLTDGQIGLIKFDQVTLVNYLLVGGESTPSNSLDNDYWSGTDETYEGLTIIEDTTVVNADISYHISTESGAIFNDITAAGTTDVSSAVILRYTSLQPDDINTSSETGTFETNVYTAHGVVHYKAVKFTGDGTITFDQDTTAEYLIFGGESTDSTSIVTDYWNGSDETYYGLNSYSASSNFTQNTEYNIVINTTGSTFNNYTSNSDGTSDSGVVIVRYQIFEVSINTYSVTGTYEENEYTDDNGDMYVAVKFTDDGTITFDQDVSVDYLVVGGGGAGGSGRVAGSSWGCGGGGGGGGLIWKQNQSFSSDTYTITIGAGGVGYAHNHTPTNWSGEDSSITSTSGFSEIALGGGGGGSGSSNRSQNTGCIGAAGGSSGGNGVLDQDSRNETTLNNPTSPFNNNTSNGYYGNKGELCYHNNNQYSIDNTGGHSGGGGGGAGGEPPGVYNNNYWYKPGGDGLEVDIWDGTDIYYAGGGAGGKGKPTGSGVGPGGAGGGGSGGTADSGGIIGGNGTDGLGGGGGGSTWAGPLDSDQCVKGGDGGSGVVIVRFLKYQES